MASSVTVEDKLRRKIKKIAAELDTTQGEVIAKAVELLEEDMREQKPVESSQARQIMKEAALMAKNDKMRQMIREKLTKPGIGIDEVKIVKWGGVDEN